MVGVGAGADASGMSSASWNPYQAAFLLASCTVQPIVGVGAGQLADDRARGVEAVDAEARGLPLQRTGRVAIGAGGRGSGSGTSGPSTIRRAVADAGDADRG